MKTLVYMMCLLILVESKPNDRPRVFCGRALAEARILYCFGPEISADVKRGSISDVWVVPKRALLWPWIAARILKRDPGLVDECCLKPCYIHQLLSYC